MRTLDGHVFLGRSIYMEQEPEALISRMDRLGIDLSVVVAPPPGPFYAEANHYVIQAFTRLKGRLAPLFRANPHLEGEVEKTKMALEEDGFMGLKLDPTNDGYGLRNQLVDPLIEVAEENGVPVYVRSGDSIFCPPEYVADLANKFPGVNFVTNTSRRVARLMKKCRNLYLTTRPFPTLAIQRGRNEDYDLDRLIFASDSPLEDPEIELKGVELAGLEDELREKILGGTLQRIMRIP